MKIKKIFLLPAMIVIAAAFGAFAQTEPMSDKTALEFFADIKAGWNLGNTFDAVDGSTATEGKWSWGGPGPATQALFTGVAQSGFDAVRIPVTWLGHIGNAPEYKVSDARLQRVAQIVDWVRDAGMKAIINVHHDGNYTDPPNTWGFLKFAEVGRGEANNDQVKEQLGKVWTQIANHFKNYGEFLIFETMNEVHSGNWGCESGAACNTEQDRLFDWNQTALNAIRATGGNNAKRFVAVPGLGSTEPGTVIAAHNRQKLLPNDPGNGTKRLIVSVHFYAPWQYTVADITGQGGEGRHTITQAELDNIATQAGRIKTTFINNGIAAYYGEWGAQTRVRGSMSQKIKDDHVDYMRRVAAAAGANGILTFLWDDGGNFEILKRSDGTPVAGFATDVLNAVKEGLGVGQGTGINAPRRGSAGVQGAAPLVTVRGRTLNVNVSADSKVRVRLVNMMGKSVASFNVGGGGGVGAKLPLNKIPAGAYIIEAKRVKDGYRTVSAVVLR